MCMCAFECGETALKFDTGVSGKTEKKADGKEAEKMDRIGWSMITTSDHQIIQSHLFDWIGLIQNGSNNEQLELRVPPMGAPELSAAYVQRPI